MVSQLSFQPTFKEQMIPVVFKLFQTSELDWEFLN